jgi:hypothetical protein
MREPERPSLAKWTLILSEPTLFVIKTTSYPAMDTACAAVKSIFWRLAKSCLKFRVVSLLMRLREISFQDRRLRLGAGLEDCALLSEEVRRCFAGFCLAVDVSAISFFDDPRRSPSSSDDSESELFLERVCCFLSRQECNYAAPNVDFGSERNRDAHANSFT